MNTGVLTSPWEVVNLPNRAEEEASFFINVKLNGIIYFGLRVFFSVVIPACPESSLLKKQSNYDSRRAGMTSK
jgi:hypothetical protein